MPFGKPLVGTLLASLTLLGLATAHAKDDMKAAEQYQGCRFRRRSRSRGAHQRCPRHE